MYKLGVKKLGSKFRIFKNAILTFLDEFGRIMKKEKKIKNKKNVTP